MLQDDSCWVGISVFRSQVASGIKREQQNLEINSKSIMERMEGSQDWGQVISSVKTSLVVAWQLESSCRTRWVTLCLWQERRRCSIQIQRKSVKKTFSRSECEVGVVTMEKTWGTAQLKLINYNWEVNKTLLAGALNPGAKINITPHQQSLTRCRNVPHFSHM